jgi:hypothetical protein
MIERADSNNDKVVTQEDFYCIMTKKTFAWTGTLPNNPNNRFSAT